MTFALRLISIPLLEYVIWRWLRKPYLEMTRLVRRGWLLFAALTGIIYLILVLLSVYPTGILERPQDIPLAVVLLILIALVYPTIFLVLFEQLHNLEAQERQRVLEAQTVMMCQRVEDILRAEETMRIERHDMRHQLQTVASLAQRGDYAALLDYIGLSQEKLTAAEPKHYCNNPVLDAVLTVLPLNFNHCSQKHLMGPPIGKRSIPNCLYINNVSCLIYINGSIHLFTVLYSSLKCKSHILQFSPLGAAFC